jgi:hypothetical protein
MAAGASAAQPAAARKSSTRKTAAPAPAGTAAAGAPAERDPLVLSGPPQNVRGRVTVANTTPERLAIRGGLLHLPDREPVAVPVAMLLRPASSTEVSFGIDLGRATPPGELAGELELGGQRRAVTVRVEPAFAVTVSPATLLAAAGETKARLLVRNDGNLAIPLATTTAGRLLAHDEGGSGATTQGRAEPAGDSPEAVLNVSPTTLEPGQETTLDVVVTIPDGLARTRRYRAALPVGPADLVVTVLPADPPPDPLPRRQPGAGSAPRAEPAPGASPRRRTRASPPPTDQPAD